MSGYCEECGNTICICAEANHDVIKRPWVELTEEEIRALAGWWPSYDQMPDIKALIRDVQDLLKAKNEIPSW